MLWKYRIAKWTDSQPYWCRFIFFQRLTSYELDKLHWKFLQIKFWDILKFLFIEQQMKINLNVKILISKNNLCQLNRLFPWVTGRWFYLRVKILQIILKLFLFTTLIWIIKLLKCNKQSWFQKNSNDLFLEGYHFCRATSFPVGYQFSRTYRYCMCSGVAKMTPPYYHNIIKINIKILSWRKNIILCFYFL